MRPESNLVTTAEEVWARWCAFWPHVLLHHVRYLQSSKACSPHPPAITWLSSSGLTGGTTRLSTHCSLTEPRTHSSFSDFSLHDLYYPTTHALHAQWGRTEQLPTGSVGRLSVLLKGSLTVVVEGGRTTSLIQHWQLHTAESSDYWSSETEKIGFQADRLTAYNRNTVMPSSCLDWLRTL